MKKYLLLVAMLALSPLFSGCGGGGANISGPNSNTQAGLGTLIVTVTTPTGGGVADGQAVVLLEKRGLPTKNSRTVFYDIVPGRYFVQARSQSIGLPGEGREVEVKADKTLRITLTI